MSGSKNELIDLLDRKVFQPILNASPDDYSGNERETLRDVQDATKRQIERYRGYDSAEDVRNHFEDDLSSGPGQRTSRDLKQLGLPTLESVRDEFLRAADRGDR